MNNDYFNLCYDIISHYLSFPDVFDTFKEVLYGLDYKKNFPQNYFDFEQNKAEIIKYIMKARKDNIIFLFRNMTSEHANSSPAKSLYQLTSSELFIELDDAIFLLVLKGMYQTIKHIVNTQDDDELCKELLQQDRNALHKYGLLPNE